MDLALAVHRLQFAFTITFHYLFPQLTMGLALLIVILKTLALRTGDEHYNEAARFWAKIFAHQLRHGRGHRHPDGVSVRHQLGALLARPPAASSARRWRWRASSPSSWSRPSSASSSSARSGSGPRGHWFAAFLVFVGLLALGLLHHRHRRVDAASGRLRDAARTATIVLDELLGAAAQSVGVLAVRCTT